MQIFREIRALRAWLADRRASGTVGFVPTMGYLHEGHQSLLRASIADNATTVLSIFVNPLQFGPNEDFERYPRDEQRDLNIARETGADAVFLPSVQEMYPSEPLVTMKVSGLADRLCGASRPGHFDGVATVVMKLFQIVGPDRAYFGLKDAQQVAVIEQLVRDLNVPTRIVPCPILRERDGLAMSSRNVYLSSDEREQALVLNRSLRWAERELELNPEMPLSDIVDGMRAMIAAQPIADVDYIEAVTWPSLDPIPAGQAMPKLPVLLALAVRFGRTRLIDNTLLGVQEPGEGGKSPCSER